MSVFTWILGFFTFIAGLNTVNAAVVWAVEGINATVPLYIIGDIVPSLNNVSVTAYFWVSLVSTFILLGLMTFEVLRRPPLGPEVHRMVSKVEDEMTATRGTLESTRISLFAKMEDEKIARQDMFTTLSASMDIAKKEMLHELEKERNAAEKARKDLETVVNQLGTLRKEVWETLDKQSKIVRAVEHLSRRNVTNAEKNSKELANLGMRVGNLEAELVPPKPKLMSLSGTEEIRGVGLHLAEELKAMGITNVGELLLSDPKNIGSRTRATLEMATRLQGRAQLLMVPGIDEQDAEMLMDLGITSKRMLAAQDPVELGRRLHTVARAYIEEGKVSESEKPTIEEISAWIKLAKL